MGTASTPSSAASAGTPFSQLATAFCSHSRCASTAGDGRVGVVVVGEHAMSSRAAARVDRRTGEAATATAATSVGT